MVVIRYKIREIACPPAMLSQKALLFRKSNASMSLFQATCDGAGLIGLMFLEAVANPVFCL